MPRTFWIFLAAVALVIVGISIRSSLGGVAGKWCEGSGVILGILILMLGASDLIRNLARRVDLPELPFDEEIEFEAAASKFEKRRQVGGRILLTNRRLFFVPNGLERRHGAPPIEIPLSLIRHLGISSGRWSGFKRHGIGAVFYSPVDLTVDGSTLTIKLRNPAEFVAILTTQSQTSEWPPLDS
jgi:hypothetical protein